MIVRLHTDTNDTHGTKAYKRNPVRYGIDMTIGADCADRCLMVACRVQELLELDISDVFQNDDIFDTALTCVNCSGEVPSPEYATLVLDAVAADFPDVQFAVEYEWETEDDVAYHRMVQENSFPDVPDDAMWANGKMFGAPRHFRFSNLPLYRAGLEEKTPGYDRALVAMALENVMASLSDEGQAEAREMLNGFRAD